jgi:hypothetical protein
MTVLVSDGSASDKRGGALMALRSYLACVAEITGAAAGYRDSWSAGELGRWF